MAGKESNLDRTYDSLDDLDALTLMNEHYGEGLDGYSFWADLSTALKALWYGIENVPEHPAQLHYAWLNHEVGTPYKSGLNEGIRRATNKAMELLKLNLDEPLRLLDVGCGVGGVVLQIDLSFQARDVDNYHIHGISIVPKQIKVATSRSKKFGGINSSFVAGNFLKLPYKSDIFDGILAFESLCHIPPQNKFSLLYGLNRALKPGGRMVILDAYFIGRPKTSEERDWFNTLRNGWTLPEMVTLSEMNDLTRNAGFEIEQSFCALDEVRPSVELIHNRARLIGIPLLRIYRILKNIGHESKLLQRTGIHTPDAAAFIQACLAQKELVDRGLLTYYVHVLRKAT